MKPSGRAVALCALGAAVILVTASAAGAQDVTAPVETTTTTTITTTTTTSTISTTPTTPQLVINAPAAGSMRTPSRGPQSQVTDTLAPPFPNPEGLPADSGEGRRVVYSKSLQRVWTIEADGIVSKTHAVSGRLEWNQPKVGTYSVYSRSTHTCAVHNPTICWRFMIRFATGAQGGNIGLHEIPIQYGRPVQTDAQLGQALSGGCVRQATADAIYMWDWAPLGTKVVVLP